MHIESFITMVRGILWHSNWLTYIYQVHSIVKILGRIMVSRALANGGRSVILYCVSPSFCCWPFPMRIPSGEKRSSHSDRQLRDLIVCLDSLANKRALEFRVCLGLF